jgi:hypothetical protein
LAVVKHITSETVWKDFKVNQAREYIKVSMNPYVNEYGINTHFFHFYFPQIAQVHLEGRKDADQVHNCWNRFWIMYKAVHRRQEHTGGGDGDEETDDDDNEAKGTSDNKRKQQEKKPSGACFSKKSLDTFEESVYYALIDNV